MKLPLMSFAANYTSLGTSRTSNTPSKLRKTEEPDRMARFDYDSEQTESTHLSPQLHDIQVRALSDLCWTLYNS